MIAPIGLTAGQSFTSFDDTALEGSPSSVNSVAVSHSRGNATRERVLKAARSEMLTETWYDANGQRTRVKDAGNNQASFSYTDNFGPNSLPSGTNGFLRTLTYPAVAGETALAESWKVDPYLGMPVEATAKNGIVTAYAWNDFLGRLKSIERTPGIGGTQQKTVFGHEDDFVPQRVTTRGARLTATDEGARAYVCYDGLGREVKSLSRVSATAWDVVDKVYSGFGEVMRVSNPYRVAPGSEPGDSTICGAGEAGAGGGAGLDELYVRAGNGD